MPDVVNLFNENNNNSTKKNVAENNDVVILIQENSPSNVADLLKIVDDVADAFADEMSDDCCEDFDDSTTAAESADLGLTSAFKFCTNNSAVVGGDYVAQRPALATVMENLPLSHETFVSQKNSTSENPNFADSAAAIDLETLSLSTDNKSETEIIDDSEDSSYLANFNGQNNTNHNSSLIGHSRSAHSFGPGDYVTNADHPRRTHFRHNSYEVTGINSGNNPPNHHAGIVITNNLGGNLSATNQASHHGTASGGAGLNYANFNRTNSLSSKTNDYSSYSSSSFSVSSLSCSDYSNSINDEQFSLDSGNVSKRSSLDRRSLASVSETAPAAAAEIRSGVLVGHHNHPQTTEEGRFKRLPQISSILPKVLFSRRSSTSVSSVDSAHSNDSSGCGPVDLLRTKFFRPSVNGANTSGSSGSGPSGVANSNVVSTEEVPSTTALILENRPSNLPPKSAEEEQKHRLLYEQMVEAAKKKEQKEAKIKKKLQREQLKQEEVLSAAVREWTNEILPKWEELKTAKRTKELWGHGLPPCVRGKIWKLAIGNELSITEELFEICVNRAKERLQQFEEASVRYGSYIAENGTIARPPPPPQPRPMTSVQSEPEIFGNIYSTNGGGYSGGESSVPSSPVDRESTVELIHLDVARTFPTLGIFQKGGPYYDLLLNVLGAYVCYRPDVGYVQGMSFLAAILLLNLDVADTFVAFANLMNRPCQLAFFRLRQLDMQRYFQAYDMYFEVCLPKLYNHFKLHDIRPNLYLIEWIYTLYAKSLPLEVTCRIWDSFLRDGEEFLFKTAIGILYHYEDILLRMDFDRCVQFLTHLPDNLKDKDLFCSINRIKHGGRGDHKKFGHFLSELAANATASSSSSNTSPINRRDVESSSTSLSIDNRSVNVLAHNVDNNHPNLNGGTSGLLNNCDNNVEDCNDVEFEENTIVIDNSESANYRFPIDSSSCEQTPVAEDNDDDDAVVIIPL